MEKTKLVDILDIDINYTFEIRLFKVREGTSFFSRMNSNGELKEEMIYQLLTLATLIRKVDGKEVRIAFDIDQAETIFKSPISVITLATEVLKFQQEVFMPSKS